MRRDMSERVGHEAYLGKLDAYLDGELNTEQTRELDEHLRGCSECTAEVLVRVQWKRATRLAGQRFSPDAMFRERIQKRISPGKPFWWHWRPALALATAALLLLVSAQVINRQMVGDKVRLAQASKLNGELADLHVATLASVNPVDVVSTDRHNVKPWFAGKIPFTFDLPDLTGTPFELVGGKVSYLDQSPGAHLLFRVRKHQISMFIFQAKDQPVDFARAQEANAQSFHLESWQQNGLQYFVISDVAPEDLRLLENLFRK
jgi:anti-sigma factor RsiW